MKSEAHNFFKIIIIVALCFSTTILRPTSVLSEEPYVFERMWPTLQQPWYLFPITLALDRKGNLFFCDHHGTIKKYNLDGQFITEWQANASGLAVDGNDYVYITDVACACVKKLSSDGRLLSQWGTYGMGDGQFIEPQGIVVDTKGYVYVTDAGKHEVQKFTAEGQFASKWGSEGSAQGQFIRPFDIATASDGSLYVADVGNNRIQKFSQDGEIVSVWGGYGADNGQFCLEDSWGDVGRGLAVDNNGNVYVADSGNHRIQKFNSDGQFLKKWGRGGSGKGEFNGIRGVAVDDRGNVYAAEHNNKRIQKFNAEGEFIVKWGSSGWENGEFNWPRRIETTSEGIVFVSDSQNNRIQKFSSNGIYTLKWGSPGVGRGQFAKPLGLAVGKNGNVYVADTYNHRIQRFSSEGQFIQEWGRFGSETGEFNEPRAIATDQDGNLYVVDVWNYCIQKFNPEGQFIKQWGSFGVSDGEFDFERQESYPIPSGIKCDHNGHIFVSDTGNHRIQKFSSEGVFITVIGEFGSDPGQFSGPMDLSIGPDNRVYVADPENNSVQVFSNGDPTSMPKTAKAIIVAGGGHYEQNNIWDATRMCANYAYRALTYQGYSKDNLYYLSADTSLDLDGNGILDDVDANATNANLQYAIQTWARDTDDLFLYMVDHGGNGTFRMGETEILHAQDLDAWLDNLQQTLPGAVTMVYDACESGSFLPHLLPPAGKQRILATSASSGEESIFVGNGTVSFSFLFWGHMFNGESFYNAFVSAKKSVSTTYRQTPLLDANGNGIGNEKTDKDLASLIRIGNETKSAGGVPIVGAVSPHQDLENATSALIYADQVVDADGISRVWVVITPPGYSPGTSETPVTDLFTRGVPQ